MENQPENIKELQDKIDTLEQEKKILCQSLKVMIGWAEKSVAVKCGADFLPRGFDTAKETLEYFNQ